MFFRRRPARAPTNEDRIENLRSRGFSVRELGPRGVEATRHGCAAVVSFSTEGTPQVTGMGVLVDGAVAVLIDGGFQKFLETASGVRRPARASDLRALHDFQEDLYSALGIESLYNESLGTVCDRHAYDRLTGRP